MEQSFWILCRSPAALSIPSCKYKASWLMATSAEFNILPAYTPSHFLCLLCKELWVSGKRSINKCIVRVTLRSGYSNNSSYFQKEKWRLFVSRGQQTTLLVSFQLFPCPRAIFIPPLLWLSTSEHLYPQGESWSVPGENGLTLFTLLSTMQILLIWEELADLSNMIIAPPSPLTARLSVCWLFFSQQSSAETQEVAASKRWGLSQTAHNAVLWQTCVIPVGLLQLHAYFIRVKRRLGLVIMFHSVVHWRLAEHQKHHLVPQGKEKPTP